MCLIGSGDCSYWLHPRLDPWAPNPVCSRQLVRYHIWDRAPRLGNTGSIVQQFRTIMKVQSEIWEDLEILQCLIFVKNRPMILSVKLSAGVG